MMGRTIAIWVFGLLASAIVGEMVGSRLNTGYSTDNSFLGMLAGILFVFICLRLWLTGPRAKNSK
jgi:hypothetical protein